MANRGRGARRAGRRELRDDRRLRSEHRLERERPARRQGDFRPREDHTRPLRARVEDRGVQGRPARRERYVERRRPRRARTPWWVWLLALLAIGLIAFMVLQGLGDDTGTDTSASGDTGGAAAEGTVTVGGTDLFSLAGDPEALGNYEDEAVEATSVPVESVVADEGFWIGETDQERLFVFLNLTDESGPQIDEGDTVSFSGTTRPLPVDFEQRFGLTPDDGIEQLTEQGHYIEVTDIDQG